MSDKVKVQFTVRARWGSGGEIEMTRGEYDDLRKRVREARGFRLEYVAQDMMDMAGIRLTDGDLFDFEIDDFEIEESQP